MDGGDWRMSERGRNMYRLYDAGLPGQVYAVYEPTAGFAAFFGGSDHVWASDSCFTKIYAGFVEQRTPLAGSGKVS